MALTSYNDLKTSVANYLGRSDLTSAIPDFISLAELRLNRTLRIRQMLKTVTASTTAADRTVGLPTDFIEMRDLFIQGSPRQVLSYMSPAAFSRNSRADETGKSQFYTLRANELVLAPYPDTAYTLEMLYYAKPDALSTSNQSNAFMANAPDALLYASLLEAEPYLMNDARMPVWSSMYEKAIITLSDADDNAEYSGVPLEIRVASR
jgi:hypothetical protein